MIYRVALLLIVLTIRPVVGQTVRDSTKLNSKIDQSIGTKLNNKYVSKEFHRDRRGQKLSDLKLRRSEDRPRSYIYETKDDFFIENSKKKEGPFSVIND